MSDTLQCSSSNTMNSACARSNSSNTDIKNIGLREREPFTYIHELYTKHNHMVAGVAMKNSNRGDGLMIEPTRT